MNAHLQANAHENEPATAGGGGDLDTYLASGAGLVGGHNNGKPDEGDNMDHLANL